MDENTNINQGAGNNADMNFSDELQQIITDNMFWLKRRSKVRQSDLAKGLGISQPTLSQKYSRAIAWTINDLAKAAVFFEVPVSYLVTNNFIEPSSEYQLRNNSATDILPPCQEMVPRLFDQGIEAVRPQGLIGQ